MLTTSSLETVSAQMPKPIKTEAEPTRMGKISRDCGQHFHRALTIQTVWGYKAASSVIDALPGFHGPKKLLGSLVAQVCVFFSDTEL